MTKGPKTENIFLEPEHLLNQDLLPVAVGQVLWYTSGFGTWFLKKLFSHAMCVHPSHFPSSPLFETLPLQVWEDSPRPRFFPLAPSKGETWQAWQKTKPRVAAHWKSEMTFESVIVCFIICLISCPPINDSCLSISFSIHCTINGGRTKSGLWKNHSFTSFVFFPWWKNCCTLISIDTTSVIMSDRCSLWQAEWKKKQWWVYSLNFQ